MGNKNTGGKRMPVRVFGLTENELDTLRELAFQRYGKASVSLLAKKLLQAQLAEAEEPDPVKLPPPRCSRRITLRLPDKDRAYLEVAAEQGRTSVNDAARSIIQAHISLHPMLSTHEADVLAQSNYQLVMIGRNLNQIARHMNAGGNISLGSEKIDGLKQFVDAHTAKVNAVLQTNRRRKRE